VVRERGGHGTVAALAVLAERSGLPEYRTTLHAGGRAFPGRAVRRPTGFEASFDPGPVTSGGSSGWSPVVGVGCARLAGG